MHSVVPENESSHVSALFFQLRKVGGTHLHNGLRSGSTGRHDWSNREAYWAYYKHLQTAGGRWKLKGSRCPSRPKWKVETNIYKPRPLWMFPLGLLPISVPKVFHQGLPVLDLSLSRRLDHTKLTSQAERVRLSQQKLWG